MPSDIVARVSRNLRSPRLLTGASAAPRGSAAAQPSSSVATVAVMREKPRLFARGGLMANVFELTGTISRNIVADANELVFPNVQTCVALVAVIGNTMVGAHMTLADIGRVSKVAEEIKKRGAPRDVYVVGPVLPRYNVSSIANFGGRPHLCDTPGFIDVRARIAGGNVTFETKKTGEPDSAYQPRPDTSFVQ
jgi:hypothetical protein